MQSISKYDYFIDCIRRDLHYQRNWILRTFTVAMGERATSPVYGDLVHNKDSGTVEVWFDSGDGPAWTQLEGVKYLDIPFIYHEIVPRLKAGDVANALVDISSTTWGEILFNARVLVYSSGDTIPFMQYPELSVKAIQNIYTRDVLDDPVDGVYLPGKLYITPNLMKLGEALADLSTYEIFIPSLDKRSLSAPPTNEAKKAALFEKYKDRLDDPLIQVKIQDELVSDYKEHIKGTPAEGFIYNPKSINTAIKRMFLLHGVEAGFGDLGKPTLIKNSLDEGLDMSQWKIMNDSLRNGAYSRGAMTALAGAGVNLINRIFQNARINVEGDGFCGTTETSKENIRGNKNMVGRYHQVKGKPTVITADDIKTLDSVQLYTPLWCKEPGNDVCRICMGEKLSQFPLAVGTMVARVPSTMMDKMMGSAHAKEQVTTRIPDQWLR